MSIKECPCGSNKNYSECCELFINGSSRPATCEDLMRSRYTAYALHEIDYIIDTISPKRLHEYDREAISSWSESAEWAKLDILECKDGGVDDEKGEVEFQAYYALEKGIECHHELASFTKIDGKWFFEDGKIVKNEPIVRKEPRTGRNESCPCGSGRKYKKCCCE